MSKYEFPKDEELEEHVPDDEVVDSVEYVGNKEIVETTEYQFECDECDAIFPSEEARDGHMASHSEED